MCSGGKNAKTKDKSGKMQSAYMYGLIRRLAERYRRRAPGNDNLECLSCFPGGNSASAVAEEPQYGCELRPRMARLLKPVLPSYSLRDHQSRLGTRGASQGGPRTAITFLALNSHARRWVATIRPPCWAEEPPSSAKRRQTSSDNVRTQFCFLRGDLVT